MKSYHKKIIYLLICITAFSSYIASSSFAKYQKKNFGEESKNIQELLEEVADKNPSEEDNDPSEQEFGNISSRLFLS